MGPPPWGPPWGPHQYYAQFAPKPGCIPLRPLTLGDIYSGSISAIRRNPATTLAISAIVAAVQAVVTVIVQITAFRKIVGSIDISNPNSPRLHAGSLFGAEITALGGALITAVFAAVLTGFITVVVTEDVLGNRLRAGQVWSRIRPMLIRLILLSLITGTVPVLGLLLCIAPGVWLWGAWALAVPAFVVEHAPIRASIGRSMGLVRGSFWRVWGIRALGYVIASVAGAVIGIPFAAVAMIVAGSGSSSPFGGGVLNAALPASYFVITAVGTAIANTVTAPFRAGVDALLYVDLRMRNENLAPVLQQTAAQLHGGAGYQPRF